jgi:hypothetical protein
VVLYIQAYHLNALVSSIFLLIAPYVPRIDYLKLYKTCSIWKLVTSVDILSELIRNLGGFFPPRPFIVSTGFICMHICDVYLLANYTSALIWHCKDRIWDMLGYNTVLCSQYTVSNSYTEPVHAFTSVIC